MGKEGSKEVVFFMNDVHAHDASAEFGTDPRNPIELPNIMMAYTYLDSLYFDDGADAIYSRVSTCKTASGHTMDVYTIKRPDSDAVVCRLYFDCYVPKSEPNVPKGFYIKLRDKVLRHRDKKQLSASNGAPNSKTGCLVPIVAIIVSIIALGAVAREIMTLAK